MSYLGENVKKLGFGLMRLPRIGDEIDIEQTKIMVDKFIAAGGTYFDTAWAYPGSEAAAKLALVDRYPRESYTLATKCAAWINCKSREDAIAQFQSSLKLTGAGYFDFYLLHNLGEMRTHFFDDFGIWDFVQEQKAKGLIKHVGFSFHSTPEELEELLIKHPEVEFVQLQINYGDWENPAIQSRAVYEMARKYNKPVVIMEPVKGGVLANPPQAIKDIFDEAKPGASYASWALHFAANLDGLITVLSGMSNIEQMEDNIAMMNGFTKLSKEDAATIERARIALANIPIIPCTTCNYCAKVCPKNIGISGSFAAMNCLTLYNNLAAAQRDEAWLVGRHDKNSALDCIKCGACEAVCPQHISIRNELEKLAEALKLKK